MPPPHTKNIVAVVLQRRGRTALLRRSDAVSHDNGLWHCVTGFLEPGVSPLEQALAEVLEETGLRVADLVSLDEGPVVELVDAGANTWQVHTFRGETLVKRLAINWEHDAYRWVTRRTAPGFRQVSWLKDVMDAVGAHERLQPAPASRSGAMPEVDWS
ncbi:dihydroneopterin triphosphate pyrophosphatase [Nocardioides dokdonensis FR1436]|uniref:Dihydroneopterin triphosphate pyrophosphatase n=1 Tax=Nocardioides dokdonensis FR1436 TaxID=1300347 RepID=A0A1A9GL04_9ACTN|nr:NUDIX domain-containing protein [Nocardioides dokdonensis]ANH38979.1 dihydroneopterin triphosphate pyrophosphatase [Nocardioides dokdonensis FR1436]